jgi:hypothetical protein
LVFAKLDRLTRNVDLLRSLLASGVDLVLAAIKTRAQEHAPTLRAIVAGVQAAGITSVRAIADELNRRAILTPRGGRWHPTSVVRLLKRLAA